jgi:RHS repeat-associated protein
MSNQASDQKKIQASKLSLPKGGGAIQGIGETFQANEFSGTSSLSVPIFASPCRDFTPQLNLSYSSGSGNSPWGMGFSLSLPQVSRQTRQGTPQYQDTDIFVLSGSADLVPLDNGSRTQTLNNTSYTVQTFAPRQEGLFALIEYWQPIDPSQAFWKVTSKDHTISIFGKTDQAKIFDPTDPARIFTWFLEESYNITGDHQLFFYKPEDEAKVPDVIYERNHVVGANRYISCVQYGNEVPIADSILLNPLSLEPITWHFEVVFDYGEYNINPSNTKLYQPVTTWAYRPDPFSYYEAGFEIRTYRRCVNTLMFHNFPDKLGPNRVLVHATSYAYQLNAAQLSECISINETGYSFDTTAGTYTTATLPPLSLSYIPFQPTGHNFTWLTDEQSQHLSGLNEPPYTLVDLFGEGIPGILYSDKATTYYREAQPPINEALLAKPGPQPLASISNELGYEAGMSYGNWQVLDTFPNPRVVNEEGLMLQDLTGGGQLDLVITTPGKQGYWEVHPDRTWSSFCPIPSWPTTFPKAGQKWVDITGDGIPDLIHFTKDSIIAYPNGRKKGFQEPLVEEKLASMPSTLEPSPLALEVITFADMAGSGQSHLVHIRNGKVMYWPNLSYCRFGNPITMGNAPYFGDDFNPAQLFLADLDGSGTIDLIYIQTNQATIYFNQSGNTFSDPITIALPCPFDSLDQITFEDIYGQGNACLVISESHTLPTPRYWCYDFCQQQKPYLLYKIDNNMGASTEVSYGSSVDFYLADKQAGLPWITPLPFPVQVITQITHTDLVSGSCYVSLYSYHHGYYDGAEREFRGFGRVDRQDAEYFPTDPTNHAKDPRYVAPALSRTWYHTGAYLEDVALSRQYAKEYYAGDSQAFTFPDSTIDWGSDLTPDGATIRQAYVAMAGTVLHTEVYGLDDTNQSSNPYMVTESNFLVRLIQPTGTNPYAIFYVHNQQTLSYNYERNPQDPQIQQNCVLAVDAYGNVTQSCAIAYPRRIVAGALLEQQQLKVTCGTQSYINQVTPDTYLIGIPTESHSYEITKLMFIPGQMFSFTDLEQVIKAALATLSPIDPSSDSAKLLSGDRYYYAHVIEDKTHPLPWGQVKLPVLLYEHHIAEFSHSQIAEALVGTPLQGDQLKAKLTDGYYKLEDISQLWWNTGLTAQYAGLSQFYASIATVDPAGNSTTYAYDSYYLFVTQVTDAFNNTVKIQAIDYQHLQPMQLVDINDNTSEVKLDPLGRVVYTSHYGHEAGQHVGFVPLSKAPNISPNKLQALIDEPATYLGGTQSYFYYDSFAWMSYQQPVVSVALVAEQYPHAPIANRIQIHLSYNDGLGRTLCSKSKVEAGEAFLYDPLTHTITTGITDDRWLTSGRVIYNNKGKPVKQYEPYYINTYDWVSDPVLDTFGVSPTIYYDALGRVTHTITAKGFLQVHTWTPWEEAVYDESDTFQHSPYCQVNALRSNENSPYYDTNLSAADRKAIVAAIQGGTPVQPSTALGQALVYGIQYFHDTPSKTIVDNLGHAIITQQINKSQDTPSGEVLSTYYQYDILGRQLSSADPRLYAVGLYNFQSTYSLTGHTLRVVSVDAGTCWTLNNTLGNPIWSYDSRQVTVTPSYDPLHRPTQIYVNKLANGNDTLVLDQIVEQFIYGDTPGAVTKPKQNNLRGQVYQHYDQASLVTTPSYSLLGAPFASHQQLRLDYKQEASWEGSNPLSLLQSTVYVASSTYDALGRVTQATDVDGNETAPTYLLSGWLSAVTLTPSATSQAFGTGGAVQVVQGITYNAKGQRLSVDYGNNTTSTYTYDPQTWALTKLKTTNAQNTDTVLQDLVYVYDPVGNVVSKTDNSQDIVYYNNQVVNPTATYTYDSLYRLIQGTGREKIGNIGAIAGREIPLIPRAPHANDNNALQNYIEKYTYDTSNNFTSAQHSAQQDSWTRLMVVSNTSNRAVISTINGNGVPPPTPDQVDNYFDSHGNQVQTQQFAPLAWNYRDNLQQATIVQHADGTCDAEYYVYNGGGQRVRKVYEQYGQGGTSITFQETLYLGGIEYRRTLQGTTDINTATVREEYHAIRVMDDQQCVTTLDYWTVGTPPSGFQNPCYQYHLKDLIGSCTVEIDDQGQQISYEEFTPFGASLLFIGTGSASQLKQYRYSGKERDSVTGFYYYGARYYAPWLGRWLSPDPAGTVNGLNIYAFVTDDPETFWDVGGMMKRKNNGGGNNPKKKKVKNKKDEDKLGPGYIPVPEPETFDLNKDGWESVFEYMKVNISPINITVEVAADEIEFSLMRQRQAADIPNYFLYPKAGSGIVKTTYKNIFPNHSIAYFADIARAIIKGNFEKVKESYADKAENFHLNEKDESEMPKLFSHAIFLGVLTNTSERLRGSYAPIVMLIVLGAVKKGWQEENLTKTGKVSFKGINEIIAATIAGANEGAKAIRNFSVGMAAILGKRKKEDVDGAELMNTYGSFFDAMTHYFGQGSKGSLKLKISKELNNGTKDVISAFGKYALKKNKQYGFW